MASFSPSAAASPPCVRGRTLVVLLAAIFSQALMAPGASAGFGPPPTRPGDPATPPQDGVGPAPSPTLSHVRYQTDTDFDQGGHTALFSMLHAFLGVVQSNELPKDIIQEFIDGEDTLSVLAKNSTKLAVYEMGFLICLAIGLLYFLLLPFVAFFFCCCRCCGKCGGRRYQSDAEARSSCRRISYSVTLLLCCLLTTGGLVCMFQANIYTHYELGKSFAGSEVRALVKNNLADINTFADNTVKQLDEVVAQYGPVKDIATNKVQNIGSIVGGKIQKNFFGVVAGPQSAVLDLVDVINRTKENLNTVNASMSTLNLWAININTTLDDIRSNLTTHLTPCIGNSAACRWLFDESKNISLAADFTPLSGFVERPIIALQSISEGHLKDELVKGNETIKNITQLVDAAASGIITGVLNTLTSVGNEIQNFSSQLDLSQYLDQINTATEDFSNSLTDIQDEAIFFDKLRFLAILGIVLLLALIVVFFTIGLCLGTCGYSKRKSPANRGCCSNCGGIFLMAGVGFVFIFSWIFMFIVAILFFIGGNIHTLACKPLADQSLFHLLDGLKIPDQAENATFLGSITNIGSNITITQVYEDCKRDAAIYSTLKMDQFQNLDELIDIQEYVQRIKDDISGIQVDLSSVNLLDQAGKDIIRDFGNSRVDSIPYDDFLKEIDKGLVNTNLTRYASELRKIALSVPNPSDAALIEIAGQLEDIDRDMPTQELDLMGASIVLLQEDTSNISNKTSDLIDQLDNAQNVLTNISSSVINLELANYIDFLILDFDLYIGWIKRMIRWEMGGCLPVANLVDSIHIIGCSCIVDSLNGIWFGLGWALVFLFISLIFAVKLAKYFRRMKEEDVFESPMYTSRINAAYSPDPQDFALPRATSGHGP